METKVEFLFLNEEDMLRAGVLDAGRCVDTVGEVMSLLSSGDYLMGGKAHNDHGIQLIFPKKSDIVGFPKEDSRDRRFMAMPAYLGGRFHMAGEKWYGSNGRNSERGLPRSILMVTLNDVETGQPLAYMSANLLSAMRTGAMPGLAAKYLAVSGAKVLSMIGAGVVNKTSLMAIMSKVPTIEVLKIKGSSPESKTALELSKYARQTYPQLKKVEICKELSEAVIDVDIVCEGVSVEPRKWPIINPEWIKKGSLIISSGSIGLDYEYTKNNVTKVVDNLGMYEEYINVYQEYDEDGNKLPTGVPGMEYANMIIAGEIQKSDVQHLGAIVRGIEPGRTSDDEIIMISLGGMPILDVGWGYECYMKALKEGIGTKLKLWDTPFMA
jgi:ornithine cyclodeaminase